MPYESIHNEVTLAFTEMTDEVKNSLIAAWSLEVYQWLNRARAYVAQSQSLAKKLERGTALKNLNNYQEMLQARRVANSALKNKDLLIDGYKLLNKIGETIRGEQIKYSVTVTTTGQAISKSSSGQVYTWIVSLEDFLSLLTSSSRRLTLKGSSTIYKMLEAQIKDEEKNPVYEQWDDEKLNSYKILVNQIRGVSWGKWAKINEGNILEIFFRFINGGAVPSLVDYQDPYWRNLVLNIQATLKSPDTFYQGGDINDIQIKGLRASVTNITTLINALTDLLKILQTSKVGNEILSRYVRKNFINEFQKQVVKTEEDVIDNLLKMFTSTIDRTVNVII